VRWLRIIYDPVPGPKPNIHDGYPAGPVDRPSSNAGPLCFNCLPEAIADRPHQSRRCRAVFDHFH
jgi:hypothetical protein